MKSQSASARSSRSSLTRIAIFVALVALIGIPLFSSSFASSSGKNSLAQAKPRMVNGKTAAIHSQGIFERFFNFAKAPSLFASPAVAESIATFAADCTTPKTNFTLGETVCAVTDGVDLGFPGGRWVDWILTGAPNTIVSGSRTTTLITTNPQSFTYVPTATGVYKVEITEDDGNGGDNPQTPAVFTVSPATTGITTYASNCLTPKNSFNLGETVCAIVAGEPTGSGGVPVRRLNWVTRNRTVVNSANITSDPQVFFFTLPATESTDYTDQDNNTITVENLGAWDLTSTAIADSATYASAGFSVHTPTANHVDLTVKQAVSVAGGEVDPGDGEVFEVYVRNNGPDDAQNVELTEAVPANTTATSFVQNSGSTFTINPVNNDGNIIATIASLPANGEAKFTFTYQVNSGTPINTQIANTVSISSQPSTQTPDDELEPGDNSSTAYSYVSGANTAETCTITCRENLTLTADATQGGNPGRFVTFTSTNVIAGSCGAITPTPASGSFFPVGTTVVNVASETGGGSCSFTITIVQTPPPTISCPANKNVTAALGDNTATVNPGTPTTTPTSGVTVVGLRSDDDDDPATAPKPLSDPYPVGVTVIDWTATDTSGNKATCQQTITVNAADRAQLTISCPVNQTVAAPSGSCEATVNPGTPTTNPSDSHVTVEGERSDGRPLSDPYPAGSTQIKWTATDDINGNVQTCTQLITVTADTGDTTPPTFTHVPGPVTVTTNACGQVVEESQLGTAEATDNGNNCQPGTVNISRTGVPAGNFFPTGTTTITYTATDAAGNSATATQTVTVSESPAIPPSVTAPADVSVNTGPGATICGSFVGDATLGAASASDNCPGVTVARTGVPAGNIFPVGNTTVTYTATDRSGNTASDTQVVTVVDNTAPIVTAPAAVTAYTGPGATSCGTVVSDATLGTASATDNCPGLGAITRTGVPSGNAFPVGTTTLTYSVTDAHGNSSSATQSVTVIDNTVPIVTPPTAVTAYTGAGATSCGTVVSDATLGSASATDNCPGLGAITRTGVPSGNVFPVGTTTVTYSVTDAHGNSSSATQSVTVIDNTAPVISCPASITLEPTCPSGAIATYTTPTATDNCAVQSVTRNAGSLASGSVFPIGTSTVTHTATDIYGNQSSCSFTVTVLTPQAVVQNLINSVQASSLTGTQKNGLLSKLNAALSDMNGGGGNACAKLSDFVNSVGNLISHGDISAAQGNAWISSANHVRNTIGCTNLPCS